MSDKKDSKNKSVTDAERITELEEQLGREKASHAEDVRKLTEKIEELTGYNQELWEEIARLKSEKNNNSSNTSLPPSTDKQKGEKRSNQYNGRTKSGKKAGGQAGHKGKTLTKEEVEEKLSSGKYKHEIIEIGERREGEYITKYGN